MPTLAALRKIKGWTPAQLAHHAGVDEQVVFRIESGTVERVSRGNMERLAAALDVHPSNVTEFRPSLGLAALGETGAGAAAKTGSPPSDA